MNSAVLRCALCSENLYGVCEKGFCNSYHRSVHVWKISSFHLLYFYNFDPLIPAENLVKTVATLHSLVLSKVLSEGITKNIPFSELKFEHLRLAYARNETEQFTSVLSEKFRGVIKVTKSKKIE